MYVHWCPGASSSGFFLNTYHLERNSKSTSSLLAPSADSWNICLKRFRSHLKKYHFHVCVFVQNNTLTIWLNQMILAWHSCTLIYVTGKINTDLRGNIYCEPFWEFSTIKVNLYSLLVLFQRMSIDFLISFTIVTLTSPNSWKV